MPTAAGTRSNKGESMTIANTRPVFRYLLVTGLLLSPLAAAVHAVTIGVGPKGGMNFGNAVVDSHDDTEMRQGLALGGQIEFGSSGPISLQVEPMYVQKGARFDVMGATTRGDFDYLEIPVLIKAKLGPANAHLYTFAGPSIGINLNTEGKIGSFEGNFEDEAASTVFSGDIGIGGEFALAPRIMLSADIRYSHGFTSALEEAVVDIDEWHSRDVRLMAGLLFNLGG
jgi:hypothetical protein